MNEFDECLIFQYIDGEAMVSADYMHQSLNFSKANFARWCKMKVLNKFIQHQDYQVKAISGIARKFDYLLRPNCAIIILQLERSVIVKKLQNHLLKLEEEGKFTVTDAEKKLRETIIFNKKWLTHIVIKKVCNKCHIEKELIDFVVRKRNKDGTEGHCRECSKRIRKERYKENPSIILNKCKQWRNENIEKAKQVVLKSYYKNKDKPERIAKTKERYSRPDIRTKRNARQRAYFRTEVGKAKLKEYNKIKRVKQKLKMQDDPMLKLERVLREKVRRVFKRRGIHLWESTKNLIGVDDFLEAFKAAQFEYMTMIDKLRTDLLVYQKYYLQNIRGGGYTIMPPKDQQQFAFDMAMREIKKTLKMTVRIMQNVRPKELSTYSRARGNDLKAKLSMISGLFDRVRK